MYIGVVLSEFWVIKVWFKVEEGGIEYKWGEFVEEIGIEIVIFMYEKCKYVYISYFFRNSFVYEFMIFELKLRKDLVDLFSNLIVYF